MADISMCQNTECPSRLECYRFTAKPNPWRQAYMDFKVLDGADKCDSFTSNSEQEANL